jgi:hypothetical protein
LYPTTDLAIPSVFIWKMLLGTFCKISMGHVGIIGEQSCVCWISQEGEAEHQAFNQIVASGCVQ